MTSGIAATDAIRFRDLIRQRLGLEHDDSRLEYLGETLRARVEATGARDFDEYARTVTGTELHALVEKLTVGETYFFRNADHFRAVAEHVLPDRIRRNAAARRLRLLSLGCATGEEPYSLAILVRNHLPALDGWNVEIMGVDVNRSALRRAADGRYTAWSLRATPAELMTSWFRVDGRDHVLDPSIRSMVRFVEHNLAEAPAPWWGGSRWDVVLCRNVLMYLTPQLAATVIDRLGTALAPDGYLFLGHAENLRGHPGGFRLRHTHDTFYYQVGSDADDAVRVVPSQAPLDVGPATPPDVGWIGEIDRSARRIEALSQQPARSPEIGPPPVDDHFDRARSLFERERVDEALAELDAMEPARSERPDALLLRAVLCTNRGRLVEAEAVCRRLLAVDEREPGVHYLLALCREGAGDRDAAAEHDRAAIQRDARFAMAHLHLGLLGRRVGNGAAAREALGAALELLAREDARRLMMFGGGFGRDALVALCRSELAACEERR